jgi:hypothetical protein
MMPTTGPSGGNSSSKSALPTMLSVEVPKYPPDVAVHSHVEHLLELFSLAILG